ncbi:MAG: hypothetical protein DRN29_01555 [Thermoplasmata archaeon]|nr:MAG: hypothetical protein DRN29_01555 [Thermoplasmata archaeon]HDN95611.1 CPBP family intramembrane metalloprotease [Thermoplasmatales archaeon]
MRKFVAYALLALAFIIIYGSAALSFFVTAEYELNMNLILFSLILNFIVMFFPVVIFVYLIYGNVWENLYFRKEKLAISILYGLIATVLFILASSIILYVIGYKEENPLAEEIGKNINLAFLILIPLISSISEETFFRAFIQMRLENKFGFMPSLLISSILFAVAHLEYKTYIQIVMPFFFGIVLGILMHKSKNIAAPISAHFFYNFFSLAIFLYQ